MSLTLHFNLGALAVAECCLIEWLGKYLMKTYPDTSAWPLIALGRLGQNLLTASTIAFSILEQRKKQDWGLYIVGIGFLFISWIPLKAAIANDFGDNREKAAEYEKKAYLISLVVKVINVGMLLKVALEGNSYEKPMLAGVIVVTYLSC